MITKRETSILKAISIISIVICHFHGWIYQPGEIISRISGSLSQSGVILFLFLSGYGIYTSCEKSGLAHYWRKRLCKIYIPFMIVVMPQFIIEIWHYRRNIGDMYIASTVLSALGLFPDNLLDGTLWFVCFILFEYVVFYCLKKINCDVNLLCVLGGILSYAMLKWKFDWVQENDIYGFAFWIGVLFAKSKKGKNIVKVKLMTLAAGGVLLYIASLPRFDVAIFRAVNGLSLSCALVIGVNLLVTYEKRGKVLAKFGNIMEAIGNISYELFLTEGIFFWNKVLYDFAGYNYRGLLLHICVITVLAVLIRKLSCTVHVLIAERMIKG